MPYVVGLTGGIGSGKSAVAEEFARLGVPVVDADAVAHALTGAGGAAMPAIDQEFGPEFLTPEGALDRERMRKLAFGDPQARDRLETILHPMVREQSKRLLREAHGPYVIHMVPLLLENPAPTGTYQRVLVVDVPEELQLERVVRRSSLPPEQVRAIMATQLPRAQRRSQATEIIDNTGALANLKIEVAALHQRYLEAALVWRQASPESQPDVTDKATGGLGRGAAYGRESAKPPDNATLIVYEYPLTEKIRTLLRLEDLFERAGHFLARSDPLEHHAVLLTLFEIMEVASRADLKSDLLQELERQKQVLLSFRSNPEVSQDALSGVIADVEQALVALFNMTGKIGQYLRENEWLMSIKQRTGIPGGACEFDLPSYHYWLHRDSASRSADLSTWIGPLYPLRDGTAIVLKLLREGGKPSRQVAQQGTFSQMLGGRTSQMVRIRLPRETQFIPEISANKYALNVRFTVFATEPRPRVADSDVEFELTFCNL